MDKPPDSQPHVTHLDQFRFCREEIKHEYNVLGSRLTSYITSQSFLFSAYAVSMSNTNHPWGITFRLVFPLIVCVVGFLASARSNPGINSACLILNRLHERQLTLYGHPSVSALDPTDPQWLLSIHRRTLSFSQAATYLFGVSWIALALLALYIYSQSR